MNFGLIEEEHPEPKQGEVRIRVRAAGVSWPDDDGKAGMTGKIVLVPPQFIAGVGGTQRRGRDRTLTAGRQADTCTSSESLLSSLEINGGAEQMWTIRDAADHDAEAIAGLITGLGYETTESQMRARQHSGSPSRLYSRSAGGGGRDAA